MTYRIISPAVLLFAIGVTGCGGAHPPVASAEETASRDHDSILPIRLDTADIAVVREEELARELSVSGTLTPVRSAVLRAELGGRVASVHVRIGERVRAGAPLVQLALPSLQAAVRAGAESVRAAELAVAQAEAERQRVERLLAAGAVSRAELEQARSAAAAAGAQQAEAVARHEAAQAEASRAVIRAPFAGVVATRSVTTGAVVQAGDELLSVVDPSALELEASVPAADVGLVAVGQAATLAVAGYPGRGVAGRVVRLAPSVDPATRQLRIAIALANDAGAFVGGTFAEGRLAVAQRRAASVPREAIDSAGTVPTVSAVRGGHVVRRPVQLGLEDATRQLVEVASGVERGDTVLVGPARTLGARTAVTLASPPGSGPVTPLQR